jgi:hypothetical protein
MVCVNKGNLQFVAFGDLQNESCIARDVQANQRRKLRKGLWNFETTRACSVNDALDVDVDRNQTQLAPLPCRRASAAAIIPAEKPVSVPISITPLRGENADKTRSGKDNRSARCCRGNWSGAPRLN